jgi:uncharacterized membrane protein YkoI
MKKKTILAVGAMTIAAVIGLVFSQSLFASADPDLTAKEVEEQVNAQYPGEITELELDRSDGTPVYEVEIVMDGTEYELYIDGNTGQVIKLDEKLIASADGKKKEETNNPAAEIREKENQQQNKEQEKLEDKPIKPEEESKESGSEERNTVITREEAIEIALQQFSGTVDDVELEKDDGRLYYEIEIESSRGEAEIEIDAFTGNVLMVDIDLDD